VSSEKTYQNILAIEGSTPVCSVALRAGGQVFARTEVGMGIHSAAIFEQIDFVLKSSGIKFCDIDAVVIGIGPGSYTGLRVVASSIKGLLFNRGIPLFGVNTLAGFAACVDKQTNGVIHAVIDARRNHVYYQGFSVRDGAPSSLPQSPELIEIPDLYARLNPGDVLVGTGIDRFDEKKLSIVNVLNIDSITAKGLIQVFESTSELSQVWVEELDVADFEPKYSIEDFHS
jgi:tRNA threonylcarbamoyl adenosine modification protein YeaZ